MFLSNPMVKCYLCKRLWEDKVFRKYKLTLLNRKLY